MKKRMAVIMVLVMILACSLAAAEQIIPVFSLQDALKKGMSPEQVARSIGTEPGYQQQLTENTLDVEYVLGSGDQAVYAALLFVDNRLTMVGCSGFAGNAADSLASLKEAMTREYGLPADVTPKP